MRARACRRAERESNAVRLHLISLSACAKRTRPHSGRVAIAPSASASARPSHLCERAVPDVAPEEAARELDAARGGIRALARRGERVAERAHRQHAPAGADDAAVLLARAGVE